MNLQSSRWYEPLDSGNREKPEGERIGTFIKRLTVRDTFAIQAKVRQATGKDKGAQEAVASMNLNDPEQMERFWAVVEHVVINHTETWRGLVLDGKDLTTGQEVIAHCGSEHVAMLMEVANEAIRGERGSSEDQKNSVSQSGPASLDSAMTAIPASLPKSSGRETVEIGM